MKSESTLASKRMHIAIICLTCAMLPSCFYGSMAEMGTDYSYEDTESSVLGIKAFWGLYGGDDLSKRKLIFPSGVFSKHGEFELIAGASSIAQGKGVWTPRKDIRHWGSSAYFIYYGGGVRYINSGNHFGYYLHAGTQFQVHRQFWMGLELMHRGGMGHVDYPDSLQVLEDGIRIGVSFSFRVSNDWIDKSPRFTF